MEEDRGWGWEDLGEGPEEGMGALASLGRG